MAERKPVIILAGKFTQIPSGDTLPPSVLGSGSPSASNYLRGDGTWATPSGTGDVTGQASSVDSEVALFSGTTGKVIKRATGSGIARVTSGVWGTAGNVVESEITLADNTTNNASAARHGFCPKLSGSYYTWLNGSGLWINPVPTGNLKILHADDVATTSTASLSSAKSYSLAANTYTQLITKATLRWIGVANTAGKTTFEIKFDGVVKKTVTFRQEPTGTGDLIEVNGVIETLFVTNAAATITIDVTQNTGTPTWHINSFSVIAGGQT